MKTQIPTLTNQYKKEIDSIFLKAKTNSLKLRETTAIERIQKIKKLKTKIKEHFQEIEAALKNDLNKSVTETNLTELVPTLLEIKHTCKHLNEWMKPHHTPKSILTFTGYGQIIYEPKGVVLIISPWNYPFQLAIIPLISAIAAGNSVILRPSDVSVKTTECLKKIITEIFPKEEVSVIIGDTKVSEYLTTKEFDHIFFTGSTRVGKEVMKNASKNLTPVTLELGGKSPVIIHKSADLKDAAKKIAWGKLLNMGQTCIAPDYILIHEKRKDKFIELLKKEFIKMTEKDKEELPKIISKNHLERLISLTNGSVKLGAKKVFGGKFYRNEKKIDPVILSDVNFEMPIMKQEIFGPILPIIPVKSTSEAIEIVNRQDKPLALYIFTKIKSKAEKILKFTQSGGSCINDIITHSASEHIPFGGIKESGFGSYRGFYGFKTFSHERGVFVQGKIDAKKYFYPPYTKQKEKLIKFLVDKL